MVDLITDLSFPSAGCRGGARRKKCASEVFDHPGRLPPSAPRNWNLGLGLPPLLENENVRLVDGPPWPAAGGGGQIHGA
jgi:hypothetical protein